MGGWLVARHRGPAGAVQAGHAGCAAGTGALPRCARAWFAPLMCTPRLDAEIIPPHAPPVPKTLRTSPPPFLTGARRLLRWEQRLFFHAASATEAHPHERKVVLRVHAGELASEAGLTPAAVKHMLVVAGSKQDGGRSVPWCRFFLRPGAGGGAAGRQVWRYRLGASGGLLGVTRTRDVVRAGMHGTNCFAAAVPSIGRASLNRLAQVRPGHWRHQDSLRPVADARGQPPLVHGRPSPTTRGGQPGRPIPGVPAAALDSPARRGD